MQKGLIRFPMEGCSQWKDAKHCAILLSATHPAAAGISLAAAEQHNLLHAGSAEDEAQYLDAVEKMIFEDSKVGTASHVLPELSELQTEHSRDDAPVSVEEEQLPLGTEGNISVCTNPFFDETGNLKIMHKQ